MSTVGHRQAVGPYQQPQEMEEKARGRERNRDGMMDGSGGQATGGPLSSSSDPPSRKRRRSRKGLDKKFECPEEGCGRSYSRAEHLYRHQLNHQPKQIYFCDFPDCKRSFVRQDLCMRHRDRHTNRPGSQLQRKDSLLNNPAAAAARNILSERKSSMSKGSSSPESPNGPGLMMKGGEVESPIMTPNGVSMNMTASPDTSLSSTTLPNSSKISLVDVGALYGGGQQRPGLPSSKSDFARPPLQTSMGPNQTINGMNMQPLSASSVSSGGHFSAHPTSATTTGSSMAATTGTSAGPTYVPQTSFAPFSLPQPAYPNLSQSSAPNPGPNQYITSPPTSSSSVGASNSIGGVTTTDVEFESIGLPFTMPVFGGDGYTRSPNWMANDFATWFFSEDPQVPGTRTSSIGGGYIDGLAMGAQNFYIGGQEFQTPSFYPLQPQHPMAVTSLIAPPSPPQESLLSEHKRQDLMDLIENYPEMSDLPQRSSSLMLNSTEDDSHPLSLHMMQSYISSYWLHFHPQLPILHRPTFSADKTPNLLLLTMMAIGASLIGTKVDSSVAQAATALSVILAWNLRWQIFSDVDFRPPAKLWVFQALLLLETFEKMFASRALHERAHIHHATTLTLMRRGSSLTGRCAYDSPQSGRDVKSNSESGSAAFSGQSSGPAPVEDAWNRWIVSEATRRAAFAAFVLDSTHATMFGHSAVLVAHEMRLQLPCDETLWAATNGAEVFKIEHSLLQAGVKPTTFLDGLKKTLNGQNVRTNSFGRTILMAGLLSVSWHMAQRDLQVTSLGVVAQLGGKDKWRQALTRSFDHWKKDFDSALDGIRAGSSTYEGSNYCLPSTEDVEHETTFESRNVMHHLAHMSMHVDIVDLQIFAGAKRLLGRTVIPSDAAQVRKRVKDWAPSARARDATFYAVQFLCQVLLPEERVDMHYTADDDDIGAHRKLSSATTGVPIYSARDDHLLNRPWVLYYASLVVWSYGFALEGQLQVSRSHFATPAARYQDMRTFLRRLGGVRSPEELANVRDKNACLGLLLTLHSMFEKARWELLVEASKLLNQCVAISIGEIQV
ncbi:fungal-specific transcription factor domain-domain-containing protein [Tuber borchii]|uniref:Fungal-specific transcription factor domain-domain-containing protein n=1 Tax=Tuber borchii TaxID=42251 RepID=A0A2T7A0M5_TUBBO|nr:fungal-specific transcription factor domain-domain-containing protein [Tuber borchii]